jgi:nucleotide-binding universal stress UspA family protein
MGMETSPNAWVGQRGLWMYKNMLVLLDGSELGEVVFKYAQELSARLNLSLELLHVCPSAEAEQLPMRRAYIEHMAQALCAGAEQIRYSLSDESLDSCIRARGTVVVGNPVEEILGYLEENDVDLVMVSTHGHSGIKEWDDIGGVANKVVHTSKVPVWLVPSELRDEIIADTLPGRPLVVPLSGLKMAEAAIPHALNIARQRGAQSEIVLLGVVDLGFIIGSLSEVREREAKHARTKDYLEGLAEPIRAEGFQVRTEVLEGEPAERIIGYLKDNPPQLICMATRGKSGLSRFVFGSVTENVIHLIKKTPMLLVSSVE